VCSSDLWKYPRGRASHCWQAGKDIPLRLHIELQNAGVDVGKLRKEFVRGDE